MDVLRQNWTKVGLKQMIETLNYSDYERQNWTKVGLKRSTSRATTIPRGPLELD